jgi:serine/threonine protein kinase
MIAHRDIKLENICIVPETLKVKIIDFGLSLTFDRISDRYVTDCCGTYEYCAPEVLYTSVGISRLGPEYTGPLHYLYEEMYDPLTADVWAFGVLFYILVYNKYPFKNPYDKLKLGKTKMVGWFGKSLLKQMLNKNVSKRISVNKITDHWWLR